MMTKAQQKQLDKRISRIYTQRCNGIQVGVMDLGKIMAEAKKAAAEGLDDAALGDRILAFVNTIRKN